jgi:hypothetical protein
MCLIIEYWVLFLIIMIINRLSIYIFLLE